MSDTEHSNASSPSGDDATDEIDKRLLSAYDEVIVTVNGNYINEDYLKSKDEKLGAKLF